MRPIDADELREKMPDNRRLIDEMPTINVNEWISVDDELPEVDDDYLVAWIPIGYKGVGGSNKCFVGVCEFENGEFYRYPISKAWRDGIIIYAWMPLPELYEVKEGEK